MTMLFDQTYFYRNMVLITTLSTNPIKQNSKQLTFSPAIQQVITIIKHSLMYKAENYMHLYSPKQLNGNHPAQS